jgi:hypothetical protein
MWESGQRLAAHPRDHRAAITQVRKANTAPAIRADRFHLAVRVISDLTPGRHGEPAKIGGNGAIR